MSKTLDQMVAEIPADKLEEVKKAHVIYRGKIWAKTDFDLFCKENNLSFSEPIFMADKTEIFIKEFGDLVDKMNLLLKENVNNPSENAVPLWKDGVFTFMFGIDAFSYNRENKRPILTLHEICEQHRKTGVFSEVELSENEVNDIIEKFEKMRDNPFS
ncbi:MAG: hypothetical protein ACRC2O_17515 [Chitinophagaceae bacterium]